MLVCWPQCLALSPLLRVPSWESQGTVQSVYGAHRVFSHPFVGAFLSLGNHRRLERKNASQPVDSPQSLASQSVDSPRSLRQRLASSKPLDVAYGETCAWAREGAQAGAVHANGNPILWKIYD